METNNILSTDRICEDFAPFEHGSVLFKFDWLPSEGPRGLLEGPVWIFVDWLMDDISGLEMCRRLRSDTRTMHAHITMVLTDDDEEERRRALRAGADDYILAPIDRTAMLDRVFALQNDNRLKYTQDLIEKGPLVVDLAAWRASWSGQYLDLTPHEFRVLRYFTENANRVLSREDIIAGLGKDTPDVDARIADVWVSRLRRAFASAGAGKPLRTVRSIGYVLDL